MPDVAETSSVEAVRNSDAKGHHYGDAVSRASDAGRLRLGASLPALHLHLPPPRAKGLLCVWGWNHRNATYLRGEKETELQQKRPIGRSPRCAAPGMCRCRQAMLCRLPMLLGYRGQM